MVNCPAWNWHNIYATACSSCFRHKQLSALADTKGNLCTVDAVAVDVLLRLYPSYLFSSKDSLTSLHESRCSSPPQQGVINTLTHGRLIQL